MSALSLRERELVALGAALASNCIPCVEFHVPAARKAGLSDTEIGEALALADKIRQVPSSKVLEAARALANAGEAPAQDNACCAPAQGAGAKACC
jgi:AhpD family alkylhydroperoxidase